MAQIGEIKYKQQDGSIISVPVFDDGDSPPVGVYKYLRVKSDEATEGFIGMSTTGDLAALKINHPVYGVLMPVSALAPVCPPYTDIDNFSTSPGNFTSGNFDNLYGSPSSNFSQIASPVPVCGDQNQSLQHASTTASTAFSNSTYWTAAPGNNIELFAQFAGTSSTFNIVIVYFGASNFSNTYRAMFDWGNSVCNLQNGGSTLTSSAITSRPTGQFVNCVVDYRNSDASLIQMDLLDDVSGTSLIGGPLTSTNTSHTGSQIGMYVKSSAADPIIVSTLRTVP